MACMCMHYNTSDNNYLNCLWNGFNGILLGNSKVQDHKSDESYERKMANMHEKQLMHERQLIFDKQIKLINKFEQAIDETQRSSYRPICE